MFSSLSFSEPQTRFLSAVMIAMQLMDKFNRRLLFNRNKRFYTALSNMRVKIIRSPPHSVTKEDLKTKTSSVVDFYNGKSIFITGGTGFLGKMYIRNILHRCPGICKIYMLIRPTSKNSAKNRLEDMIKNSMNLFEGLNENIFMKLVAIEGDVTAPNLGIHPDKKRLLQEQVSIIVHTAATIDINETLQDAYHVNVTGTENLLAVAKDMKKLQAFLHLSTFYCCMTDEKTTIEEKLYSPPLYVKDVPKVLEKYGHMRFPPQSVLGNKRNTYIFTKAISEYLVSSTHGDIPTAIIRPSLIGCSKKDPYKGWMDVFNIHSSILTAISNGLLRLLSINKNTVWDFIPVDYVANLMILAATKCKKSTEVDIYNCASSGINPVTISSAASIFISDFVTNKKNEIPVPFVLYLESQLLGRLLNPFLHLIPAYINDIRCILTGRKANSVKSIRKLLKIKDQIIFFGGHSWKAKSDHVTSLINSLSVDDRKKFPCDPSDINWVEYFREYSKGARNYLSKNKNQKK